MFRSQTVLASAFVLLALAFVGNCRAEDKDEKPAKAVVLCKEHGVPEDVCVLCHPKLAKEFKSKGDWCKEHKVAESQCFACHPELAAKFKAMAKGEKPPADKKDDDKK